MASKTTGYIVMERTEEFEQGLAVRKDDSTPPSGVLDWTSSFVSLFPDHASARAAINRTEHYRLAFGAVLPEKKFCVIVPVRFAGKAVKEK